MKAKAYLTMVFQPALLLEQAAERSSVTALGINAVYGMLALSACVSMMLSMFTAGFAVSLVLLFGPLLGFIVSSLYPRVEMTVGRRLGGNTPLDELYRLFAWSFLPAGPAFLLVALQISLFERLPIPAQCVLAIPSIVLFSYGLRNYCSNVIAIQRFALTRGLVELVMTFILFDVLVVAGLGLASVLLHLVAGETLSIIEFCS